MKKPFIEDLLAIGATCLSEGYKGAGGSVVLSQMDEKEYDNLPPDMADFDSPTPLRVWENTCDWGSEGQMQVNSKELTITCCMEELEDHSVWRNFQFHSRQEMELAVKLLELDNFHVVL